MKKIILLIVSLLITVIVSTPCLATSYQMLGVGDSIMAGWDGYSYVTTPSVSTLSSLNGLTYTDQGVNGEPLSYTLANISTWLSAYTPTRVYSEGSDWGQAHSDMLSKLNSLLSYASGAGASLYLLQYTPCCQSANPGIEDWDAYLEDWAYLNNIPVAPTLLEMSDPAKDNFLRPSYTDDWQLLHPNQAGYNVLGYLYYHTSIPTRSRDWGSSSYPDFGHESFSWWVASGSGATFSGGTTDGVTGHKKGGTWAIDNTYNIVSNVIPLYPTSNKIEITATATQGTPIIGYRYKTTSFSRTSATSSTYVPNNTDSFTTYTTPFSVTAGTVIFLQIQLANASAIQLQITGAKANWNYTNTVIDGVCGSDNGQTLCSTPTNLCNAGTPSAVTGQYSWSCTGSGGGSTANCTASYQATINGSCGTSSGGTFGGAPLPNSCATGTLSSFTLNGNTWTWHCVGLCGGTTDSSCTATYSSGTSTAANQGGKILGGKIKN